MSKKNFLVLSQHREKSTYNDFIGKYYHFPGTKEKNYLNQFDNLPIEFIYYEPTKMNGKGEYFGYGRITKKPFQDKRETGFYFAEVEEYREFSKPISYKDSNGDIIEERRNPHYNAQNAVRKIPENLLEEICLDAGIILNIESDAHLIKVLGEQLIASEKVGVLELIKNSIDAQATYCKVRLEKIPKLAETEDSNYQFNKYDGPVIIIEDDGIGMTKEVIQYGWLRPASTIKTNIKEKLKKERKKAIESGKVGSYDALYKKLKKEHGRIPLGEKGVGRFATHRLGRFLELKTKTKDKPYELVLKIDWNKFDSISDDFIDLNSIGVSLSRQKPSRDYGEKQSGTQLIIYGGRDGFHWEEDKILELNKSILSINSPYPKSLFKDKKNINIFNAFLECPQLDKVPNTQPHEDATSNFIFDALINEEGIVDTYEIKFKHPTNKIPEKEWSGENEDLRINPKKDQSYWDEDGDLRKPQCGSFYIHMDVWYRTKEWIDLPDYKTLTDYLDEFGGMSIYRDNIMVFESKLSSENDWLELKKAHIKQGYRISYYNFIGNIELNQFENFELIDKTNREGLIENQAYKDLSILTRNAIEQLLLIPFMGKRDELAKLTKGLISDTKTLNNLAKTSSTFISNITESDYPLENDPYKFFSKLWEKAEERKAGLVNLGESMKELQKSVKLIEEVQDMFVEQAGFGIAVAVSLHEINKITSNFYNGVSHLIKSGDFNKIKLEDLKATSDSLRSEIKRMSPLRAIRNEQPIQFNIVRSINYVYEVFKRKFKKENIDFKVLNPEEDFNLYGRYATINQVLGNLFDNSIYWINRANGSEKFIHLLLDKKYRTLIVADSGTDISEIIRPYLFQPGYSLKDPPSGLGLYICKTYLNSMKGRIYETAPKDRIPNLSGAHFTIDFNKTPEKK